MATYIFMSKKDVLFNPYRPGDEDHLYFNDSKILKHFFSSMALVEKIMGGALVATGLLIFFGAMPAIGAWIQENIPFIGTIG